MNKVTPFLMFNDQLEAAIEFHTATLPSSEVRCEEAMMAMVKLGVAELERAYNEA